MSVKPKEHLMLRLCDLARAEVAIPDMAEVGLCRLANVIIPNRIQEV
jgi:hypothetical protein